MHEQQADTPIVSNSVDTPSNILPVINEALETTVAKNEDESTVYEGKKPSKVIRVIIVQIKKTKDWALVQNAASAGGVKVELGFFR